MAQPDPTPAPSGPGPSSRDAILDAAEHLFAARGLTGTSIKEIGKRSGTNSALLYYYFSGKEDLYRACLTRRIEEFAREGQARLESASPTDAIGRLVAHQVAHLTAHPNLLKLMVRELLDHEGAVAGPIFGTVMRGMFSRFAGLIRRGQEEWVFRRDLDPELAAVSTIAQVVYFLIAQPAIRQILDAGHAHNAPLLDRFGEHASAFALSALAPPSPEVET